MKMRCSTVVPSLIGSLLLLSSVALAQAPAPAPAPVPVNTGSLGGGLALTSGNTDTKNFNLAFSFAHDPKTKNVVKASALYLRGTENKLLSLDRSSVVVRDEYKLSGRIFLFGQTEYLRDKFKDIRYLVAPTGGLGYRILDSDNTKLQVSGGAGGIWEKNSGIAVSKSGSLDAGQEFSQKLSATSKFTESVGSLWKTNDFSDSLTNFSTGLTTSINKKLELKVEFLDSFKNKPPNPSIKKNDTALVLTFLLKY